MPVLNWAYCPEMLFLVFASYTTRDPRHVRGREENLATMLVFARSFDGEAL